MTFDEVTNEFQLVYGAGEAKSRLPLYHCPFCGGTAPPSRRGELFARLTPGETVRLQNLTAEISTLEDALRVLGTPQGDWPGGETRSSPSRNGAPEITESARTLFYSNQSELVDLYISEREDGCARVRYVGRYIGPPRVSDKPSGNK